MTTWVWWWQQYAQGAIDAYAAPLVPVSAALLIPPMPARVEAT